MTSSTLFVVATPIGNRADLSPRAREILEEADLVAAEDTRHTGRLLSHLGIKKRQISLHEHNEVQITESVIVELKSGKSVALVTDAGTPLLSDPGYRLLAAAHAAGIAVSPLPGPSAITAALSVAGLPTDRFCFEGFLPAKRAARRRRLEELAGESRTVVLFESVHRITACVADLVEVFSGERRAFVGRELTKMHEQCIRATLGELAAMLADGRIPRKGEFVLVVEGAAGQPSGELRIDPDELLQKIAAVVPPRQAADIVAALTGRGRNELYRWLIDAQSGAESNGV